MKLKFLSGLDLSQCAILLKSIFFIFQNMVIPRLRVIHTFKKELVVAFIMLFPFEKKLIYPGQKHVSSKEKVRQLILIYDTYIQQHVISDLKWNYTTCKDRTTCWFPRTVGRLFRRLQSSVGSYKALWNFEPFFLTIQKLFLDIFK